jgi:hypothetical protein
MSCISSTFYLTSYSINLTKELGMGCLYNIKDHNALEMLLFYFSKAFLILMCFNNISKVTHWRITQTIFGKVIANLDILYRSQYTAVLCSHFANSMTNLFTFIIIFFK